MNINKHSYPIE